MKTRPEGQPLTTADALGDIPIFRYLDRWVVERLADQMSMIACPGGPIVHEGDSGDGLYIIKSGTVKVTKSVTGDRPEAVLAFLHDGDSFGEIQLIDGLPRSASVIAMEPVECYVLGPGPFSKDHPRAGNTTGGRSRCDGEFTGRACRLSEGAIDLSICRLGGHETSGRTDALGLA